MGTGMGIKIFFILLAFTVAYKIWRGSLPKLNLSKLKVPDFMKKVPDFAKTWKFWKWVVGVAVSVLLISLIRNWYLDSVESASVARSQKIKARQEYCTKNIWANGCVPEDTVFSREVVAGSAQTVVIPPGYRLDWWDTDGCESFSTRHEKAGILVFQYFETTLGVERTTLHFHLFKPSNPYETPKSECTIG